MINSSKISKRELGNMGENIAVSYLMENNFTVLERNYRFSRLGEIDIVASENEYICFIEVKTRSNTIFGTPSEAVNIKKQNKIKKISQIYLKEKGLLNRAQRFDVLEIIMEYNSNKAKGINLIRDAF